MDGPRPAPCRGRPTGPGEHGHRGPRRARRGADRRDAAALSRIRRARGELVTRLADLAVDWEGPADGVPGLARFLALLATDNHAPPTVRDLDRRVDAHAPDALSGPAVPELAAANRVADLGAGAGVPGLVLAAGRPGMQVTEVESASRKCAFLERAIAAMGLA